MTDVFAPFTLPLRREGDAAIVDAAGKTVLVIDPDRDLEDDQAEAIADHVFNALSAPPAAEGAADFAYALARTLDRYGLKDAGWADADIDAAMSEVGEPSAVSQATVNAILPMVEARIASLVSREEGPVGALADAQIYGLGVLVDGERVAPERVMVLRVEAAEAEPWHGDRDPQEVDQAYGDYDGTSCELCSRQRVIIGAATGKRICEKCGHYQESEE